MLITTMLEDNKSVIKKLDYLIQLLESSGMLLKEKNTKKKRDLKVEVTNDKNYNKRNKIA